METVIIIATTHGYVPLEQGSSNKQKTPKYKTTTLTEDINIYKIDAVPLGIANVSVPSVTHDICQKIQQLTENVSLLTEPRLLVQLVKDILQESNAELTKQVLSDVQEFKDTNAISDKVVKYAANLDKRFVENEVSVGEDYIDKVFYLMDQVEICAIMEDFEDESNEISDCINKLLLVNADNLDIFDVLQNVLCDTELTALNMSNIIDFVVGFTQCKNIVFVDLTCNVFEPHN